MWSQAVFISLLAAFALTNGSLLDALTAVHANPAFHTLQPAEQVLIIELIAEVEAGELKSYIDQVGFHHVLAIIDKLPAAEAHVLTQYLVKELQIEEAVNATTAVGRRDLTSVLHQVMANAEFQRLPLVDQNMVKGIVTAAENGTLSAYVQQVGYSTLLTLFDALPQHEGHVFETYLFQHLASERGH